MTRTATFSLAILSLSLYVASGNVARADDKPNVTGAWAVEVDLGGQTGMPSFTFKQDGEKLTGKYKGQFGEADVTGTVKGNDIEFTFEIQGGGKAVYKGTIEKDTMKGKVDYAGQAEGTFKGKKKEEEKK